MRRLRARGTMTVRSVSRSRAGATPLTAGTFGSGVAGEEQDQVEDEPDSFFRICGGEEPSDFR